MATELLAILSGLASALSWGAGDFAGGLASRRAAAIRVVLVSQAVGTVALLVLALLTRAGPPSVAAFLWGAPAGLAGGVGLLLLYLSLARGKMGVAAPLTAVAAGGIPLAVGILTEGLPGPAQLAGFLLALVAIWIISRPDDAGEFRPGDALLPLLAGVGFGGFLAIIGRAGDEVGLIWPLVAARLASMAMFVGVLALGWRAGEQGGGGAGEKRSADANAPNSYFVSRISYLRTSFPLVLAVLAGLGDTGGNAFFSLSAQVGRLDVAAVLSSLYPAATVLLARWVLDERLSSRQGVGVALALAAVVLIAL